MFIQTYSPTNISMAVWGMVDQIVIYLADDFQSKTSRWIRRCHIWSESS